MDSKAVQVLESMIRDAEEKAKRLQDEIALEKRFIEELKKKMSSNGVSRPEGKKIEQVTPSTARFAFPPDTAPVVPGSTTEKILNVFAGQGNRVLGVKDLVKELEKQGMTSTSPKGIMPIIVSALLRRKDLFENVSRGAYRLKT